jgi:hypothetical protein
LVLVSILDVESLQQIAGDYREYKKIEDIDALIPEMAKKLAQSVQRDTSKLPGLSVPPFDVVNGVEGACIPSGQFPNTARMGYTGDDALYPDAQNHPRCLN